MSSLLPVIAIHGAGGSRAHWDDVVGVLGAPAWLETIELPGRGDDQGAIDHVDAMLDAVLSTLDAHGITRAVWAGHSMGGIVSQRAAARVPERVAGLVLASTTPRFSVPPAVFDAIADDWNAFVDAFPASVFARSAPEEMRRRAADVLRQVGPRTLDADLRTALSLDGREALATLAAPAIVLVGDRDRLTPPSGAEAIARGMRDATLHVLEGAGHMLTYERPTEIAEAIRAMRARV